MRTLIGLLLDWLQLVRSPRARPYLLVTLLVDSAFVFVFLVALQSYLPDDQGGGASIPGYALAAYGTAKLMAQLFGGRLIDHIGRRRGLLSGFTLIVLGQMTLLGAAQAPFLALPAAAVYGFGGAVLWPAIYALASTTFAATERAKLTSAMTLTTGAALSLGLGLGFVLPDDFPYTAAMAMALVAVVLALIYATTMRAEADEWPGSRQTAAAGRLRDVAASALQPRRLGFAVIMLLQSSATGALIAIFRSYGRDILGVSFREELLMLTPAALLAAGAVVLGGVFADKLGRIPLLGLGFLCAGLAIWLLSAIDSPSAAILLTVAASLGLGLALPSVGAMSMDLSRSAGQGMLLAWFMTMEGAGHAIGPALGAWVGTIADTETVLQVVAGLFVAAVPVTLLLLTSPSLRLGVGEVVPDRGDRLMTGALKDGS